jgi:MerR family glutamine synthetase transcriptional repressor
MDPVPRDMAVLTIGIVSQLTGLSVRMIRYYEDLGLVVSFRTSGDQRRYSINDVARFLLIKDMIAQEYTIAQIRKALHPPVVPTQPTVQPTPTEQELNDRELLEDIREQLRNRKERMTREPTLIEGQLSQFFRKK